MRRTALVLLLSFLASGSIAQVYIGGGIRFWDNNDDGKRSISFTPDVGYRASKRFAFGAVFGYEYSKHKGMHSDTYSTAPYLRHFVYTFNGLDLFWEATLEFCYYDPNKGKSGYCIGIGAKPGISYTINEHFCLSAYMGFFGYRHCRKGFTHPQYEPGLGLSLTNDLGFSFHYYF
jgi:hypothetical protein